MQSYYQSMVRPGMRTGYVSGFAGYGSGYESASLDPTVMTCGSGIRGQTAAWAPATAGATAGATVPAVTKPSSLAATGGGTVANCAEAVSKYATCTDYCQKTYPTDNDMQNDCEVSCAEMCRWPSSGTDQAQLYNVQWKDGTTSADKVAICTSVCNRLGRGVGDLVGCDDTSCIARCTNTNAPTIPRNCTNTAYNTYLQAVTSSSDPATYVKSNP